MLGIGIFDFYRNRSVIVTFSDVFCKIALVASHLWREIYVREIDRKWIEWREIEDIILLHDRFPCSSLTKYKIYTYVGIYSFSLLENQFLFNVAIYLIDCHLRSIEKKIYIYVCMYIYNFYLKTGHLTGSIERGNRLIVLGFG